MNLLDKLKQLKGYTGKNSVEWFQTATQKLRVHGSGLASSSMLRESGANFASKIEIGKMYLYEYDPKWKDKLPYWDRFPLIFVINTDQEGYLGLNVHYLRPDLRLAFFDKLNQFADDKRLSPKTKLAVQYKLISDMTKFPEVSPCIKRYLWGHVKSKWLEIPPSDWRNSVMLPLQSFQKAHTNTVWAQSSRKMKNGN